MNGFVFQADNHHAEIQGNLGICHATGFFVAWKCREWFVQMQGGHEDVEFDRLQARALEAAVHMNGHSRVNVRDFNKERFPAVQYVRGFYGEYIVPFLVGRFD